MVKVYRIVLNNEQHYEAFKKNVNFGERYITATEAQEIRGTTLNENRLNMTIPWTSIDYIIEAYVDREEPGTKPQPEKPKTKMWRLAKEEITS